MDQRPQTYTIFLRFSLTSGILLALAPGAGLACTNGEPVFPEGSALSTSCYIPNDDLSGYSLDLSRATIERAIRDTSSWGLSGSDPILVAIGRILKRFPTNGPDITVRLSFPTPDDPCLLKFSNDSSARITPLNRCLEVRDFLDWHTSELMDFLRSTEDMTVTSFRQASIEVNGYPRLGQDWLFNFLGKVAQGNTIVDLDDQKALWSLAFSSNKSSEDLIMDLSLSNSMDLAYDPIQLSGRFWSSSSKDGLEIFFDSSRVSAEGPDNTLISLYKAGLLARSPLPEEQRLMLIEDALKPRPYFQLIDGKAVPLEEDQLKLEAVNGLYSLGYSFEEIDQIISEPSPGIFLGSMESQ